MQIENFRQFYGGQQFDFAFGDQSRNVTVFHGFNGAGKTALLNAFIWGLYGKTTVDFTSAELLANERRVAETNVGETVLVSVALRFEHKHEDFRVVRTRIAEKVEPGRLGVYKDELQLQKIGISGEMEAVPGSVENRQKRINQILPVELYRFFFFNGERMENLASADAFSEVQQGVRTLLDVEIYDRGYRHLNGDVMASLRDDLRRTTNDEGQRLIDELQKQEAAHATAVDARAQVQQNTEARRAEIADIEKRQREIKELAALAEKMDAYKREFAQCDEEIRQIRGRVRQVVSKNGYLAFSVPSLEAAERLIADARVRGDIPAKIKPQFVDDLLQRRLCICGRSIDGGSNEEHALHIWRSSTGLAEFEERIAHLSALIPGLAKRREELYESLRESLAQLQTARSKRQRIKDDMAAVDEQLVDRKMLNEHAALQERVRALRDDEIHDQARLLKLNDEIENTTETVKKTKAQLSKVEAKEELGRLAQKRIATVENVTNALKAIAEFKRDEVRAALDRQIKETWRDAAIKNYEACLTEDYQLKLKKHVGGVEQDVQGASTGEKQVLALSFVASLVKKAKDNTSRHMNVSFGSEYPLVMDSPFGSLEDEYRSKVAEWVPRLSQQVVVMASKSQWRNEVETAMRPRIGREYVLELHTPRHGADRSISIDGTEVPYVVQTTEPTEFTIIRKV